MQGFCCISVENCLGHFKKNHFRKTMEFSMLGSFNRIFKKVSNGVTRLDVNLLFCKIQRTKWLNAKLQRILFESSNCLK